MFRTMICIGLTSIALSLGVAHGGALEQLSQGGTLEGGLKASARPKVGFQGFWSQPSHQHQVQPTTVENYAFQVRYYKLNWRHKKYATFRTFVEAKGFMLKMKMGGYYADLAMHELPKRPAQKDDWLP